MVEIQKSNADEEKSDKSEQEEMPLLENHDTLSDLNRRAASTTISEKECSVVSTKVELCAGEKTNIRVRFQYLFGVHNLIPLMFNRYCSYPCPRLIAS